jgi:hypothetical protein
MDDASRERIAGTEDVDGRRKDGGKHDRCEIDMAIGIHAANSKDWFPGVM